MTSGHGCAPIGFREERRRATVCLVPPDAQLDPTSDLPDRGHLCQNEGARRRALDGIIGNGASKESLILSLPGESVLAGVSFRTGGSLALSAFSPRELPGFRRFDTPWARELYAELVNAFAATGHAGLSSVLDRAFSDRFCQRLDTLDWNAVELYLLERTGRVGLEELARLLGLSTRIFQRACLRSGSSYPGSPRGSICAVVVPTGQMPKNAGGDFLRDGAGPSLR